MVVESALLLQVKRVKETPSFSVRSMSNLNHVGTRSGLLA
jgi:hypothetical protein